MIFWRSKKAQHPAYFRFYGGESELKERVDR